MLPTCRRPDVNPIDTKTPFASEPNAGRIGSFAGIGPGKNDKRFCTVIVTGELSCGMFGIGPPFIQFLAGATFTVRSGGPLEIVSRKGCMFMGCFLSNIK